MTTEKVLMAEDEIAKILKRLEIDTGLLVSDLSIFFIEITAYPDVNPRYKVTPKIKTMRLPGHEW